MVWPQIPRTDAAPQTAATAALASLAYRDGAVKDLTDADQTTTQKPGRVLLFTPTLGEAFCRAVLARTLGAKRKPTVPSFGTDPRLVVEHCLEAEALRHQRDRRLTAVAFFTGFLFLPGTLIWLAAFEIRRRSGPGRQSVYGGAALAVAVLLAALFAWRPFAHGYAGLYVRIMMLVPVLGWFIAQRICLRTAEQLRERWNALLDGNGVGPLVPGAVPIGPEDVKAETLRKSLAELTAEQDTNIVHYAGAKGILGMGARWASWQLAEQLDPREGVQEIRAFHPWDVIKKIEEHLHRLERSSLATGAIPAVRVGHWAVVDIPEGADEFGRPSGPEMDGTRMRGSAITDLANRQQFGRGPRHYLGTQFVLWEGQLVVTLLVTVTVLHHTLRVEVAGHALGPLSPLFGKKAAPQEISVAKTGKFWEEQIKHLPIVTSDEVVRLALRAPFTWPWGETMLDWLGGTMKLPEPFGLRSAWATRPWTRRFMADDALRVATPVLRAVHAGTMEVLKDHDVDVDRFKTRSLLLGAEIQGVRPSKVDEYDAR
ncbi:hypothetical protein ABIA33_001903 [Streptacidiphilus sp. MAP12-16]|uniref:hypothetical protein n=1 Tax=Streptacidiphilus sp. MAP12-16 TaxID=3156300 RepID=UPI003513F619